jgi:hypothetical protein
MHDGLRNQIVEAPAIAALGGGAVDFKQRFGLRTAHRLMLDGRSRQDTLAPRHIMGVELAGEMHTAFGGGAFAGDDAVADDG